MDGVKVQSIDSLKLLRIALCKFGDTAQTVLSDVDGELQRALNWLATEARSYWQTQIHSRKAAVEKAKEALRAKKLFHADGFRPSVVDEEKAVRLAIARLQEAEAKLVAVHRYEVTLSKEYMQYKGQVQRFTNMVGIDIPIAVGRLDALLRHLEAYLAVKAEEAVGAEGRTGVEAGFGVDEGLGSMKRAVAERGEDGTTGSSAKETKGQDDEKGGGGEVTHGAV